MKRERQSVLEKASDFFLRTLFGSMPAGAIMATSWVVAKYAFNATPGDDAIPETILAAAGLGVASALMTDNIEDAVFRGAQLGGAATAVFALAGGKEGNFLGHVKDGIASGQNTFNGWVRDPVCDLIQEYGPESLQCNAKEEMDSDVLVLTRGQLEEKLAACRKEEGVTCFTDKGLENWLEKNFKERTTNMNLLTDDDLQKKCLELGNEKQDNPKWWEVWKKNA